MLKKGNDWNFGIDYANEFLNTFGHLFINNNKQINVFIEDYLNNLFFGIFYKFGLIEINDITENLNNIYSSIKIKGSNLLFEWLSLKI